MPEDNPILDALQVSVLVERKDQTGQVPWTEWRTGIVVTGGTSAQAGDLPMLGVGGTLDPSVLPSTTGLTIQVGGVAVANQDLLNFIAGSGITITSGGSDGVLLISATGVPPLTSLPFGQIITGTNLTAHMTVSDTAILQYSGSGIINANEIGTINVAANLPTHAGMLLISQPGNTSAAWADPQVQGLYAAGSSIASPPSYVAPTTIQPILIGAADPSGNLQNLNEDVDGNLFVSVANFPSTQPVSGTVSVSNFPSTQAVSGTVAVSNFPTEFEVTQGTSPWVVSGSVSVSNFPATQPVSGTITVANTSPTVTAFHTAQASSLGLNTVWTPASGKRFRLSKFQISATEDREQSVGGDITVQLYDGSTPIAIAYDTYIPASINSPGLSDFWQTDWVDLGSGYLSAAVGNVLSLNLTTSLTSGNFRVNVIGDEE